MGNSPFDPNKRKKQKPEHNGEFNEQHGKHPQTLNELLDKETKSACATANTNAKENETAFEFDPYSNIDGLPNDKGLAPIDAPCSEQIAAMQKVKEMKEQMRYKD